MTERHATRLDLISLDVPPEAVAAYEAALASCCATVGLFLDEARGWWRLEAVRPASQDGGTLHAALALAEAVSGVAASPEFQEVAAEGWLARTAASFPEQRIGRRFAVRGTHLPPGRSAMRLTLILDAGVAFGSGEHGSTRGCLLALERLAPLLTRRARVLDLGTGSGVLAMAAAMRLRRPVLATDLDPWAVRTATANARRNGLGRRVRCVRANGWQSPTITRAAPFDLVFANILARPLCAMAASLAAGLRPGGRAVLSGLLATQARMVLAAHARGGLRLEQARREGAWMTLVLRKPVRDEDEADQRMGWRRVA